ncbi:MAG: hypothetical protein RQ728_05560 [Brevefilum sp.]|jgi:hypothetical protein|nr:hypothetical protein [Brevefilum sp.]MDT8381706.1 hypothetical protein [Brevefilum sp.]MDW7755344.1 hypothetical protein [Brevefilum sp.]
MGRYRTVEITAAEVGREQADMYASLIMNLKERGIREDLIEKIAVNVSSAGLCIADGCKGVMDPYELVGNPIRSRL